MKTEPPIGALSGIRVLELGQLLAAPFATFMLGNFGAEVIKVEPPKGGDPMRSWRKLHNGTSLWWYSISRNKKSITLNLADPRGQEIARQLVAQSDIVVENFRPGRLEEWNLGYEQLKAVKPDIIMVRISGYGQTGPYAKRPGFASVCEGMGGLRYVTGEPGRPPVRTGVSLGDTLAGLHAAYGALAALRHRDKTGEGQVVDTAIYESVFNMMESLLPEYDLLNYVREPCGSRIGGIVPSNTYKCKDGIYLIIGGNNDGIFTRLMKVIGRTDLAHDPELKHNPGRVSRQDEIDAAIQSWVSTQTYSEAFEALERAEVPIGPIYSIRDIASDPHYKSREMFQEVTLPDGLKVKIPGIVPKLSATPGSTESIGPVLGADTQRIIGTLLGISDSEINELHEQGII